MTRFHVSRRRVLAGTGAIASALALGPRWSWGAEGKILKVRSYSDLQVLDPINRKSAPEDHITSCTFHNLIKWKPEIIYTEQLLCPCLLDRVWPWGFLPYGSK